MKINCITLALLFLLGAVPTQAQQNIQLDFSGFVFSTDGTNKEPLPAASISAHAKDSTVLGFTQSDELGHFLLQLDKLPQQLIISYVGYEPYVIREFKSLSGQTVQLDTCFLRSNTLLKELVVSGSTTQHKLSGEEHLITHKMRSKAAHTLDLLDQIPGLRYDKMSNEIKIMGKSHILYLVNSLEQSKDYILNLNPKRIAKISVDKSPRGRFQSEGYDAIINIVLKSDYQGYDLILQNFAIANLEKNNGKDWLMSDQPAINLVYTNKKVNLFANYTNGFSKWNMEVDKQLSYTDLLSMDSYRTKKNDPNDIYKYQGNVVNAGINYKLSPKQMLSLQGDYTYSKIHTDNCLDFEVKDLVQNKEYQLSNHSSNKNNSDNYSLSLFYTGELNNKLKIYSDLSYNYFSNQVANTLLQNSNNLAANDFKEKRNLVKFNANVEYLLSHKFVLDLGYKYNYKTYQSSLADKTQALDYKDLRHRIYGHAQYYLSEKLQLELGTGLEYMKTDNQLKKKDYWQVLPYFMLNYTASPHFNTKLSYLTDIAYPSLYQLSTAQTPIDAQLTQRGNPNLKTSVNHSLSLDFNFWDRLTFTPSFTYSPQQIEEFIEEQDQGFLSTFKNTRKKYYALQLVYEQPLGKYFSLSNSINYFHERIKYQDQKHAINGVLFDSELSYFNPKYVLMMQLGYYRSLEKKIKIQGYQMYNFDAWVFTANKRFLKNKLNVMLSYFLPLKWGVRSKQEKMINAPYYKENYKINLQNYRNTLIFSVSYRFNSGKAGFSRKKNPIINEERINRTFDF